MFGFLIRLDSTNPQMFSVSNHRANLYDGTRGSCPFSPPTGMLKYELLVPFRVPAGVAPKRSLHQMEHGADQPSSQTKWPTLFDLTTLLGRLLHLIVPTSAVAPAITHPAEIRLRPSIVLQTSWPPVVHDMPGRSLLSELSGMVGTVVLKTRRLMEGSRAWHEYGVSQ